jgi:D-alanine-D-alanine ligase
MAEYALRALRHLGLLRRRRIGALFYLDEGRECRYSGALLHQAMSRAGQVLVVRPGGQTGQVYCRRRGQRKYRLLVEGVPVYPGRKSKRPEVLLWVAEKLGGMSALSSRQEMLSLSVADLRTDTFPMQLPHRVRATMLLTYGDPRRADEMEQAARRILGTKGPRWQLEQVSDRPPMRERRVNRRLAKELSTMAQEWDIPLEIDSSVVPSVAGLAPAKTAVVCGLGPVARDLNTPQEAVQRISLMQRTLLLAQFLLAKTGGKNG